MNDTIVEPGKTIGILGGGQLGRMMGIAAKEMGYRIAVLDPTKDSPCGQIADIEIDKQYEDLEAAQKLLQASDVVTYEFENVAIETARYIEERHLLPQGSHLLEITRDRALEKGSLSSYGVQVAPYQIVKSAEDLRQAIMTIGLPAVLKTTRGGYDGKGQWVLRREEDVAVVISELNHSIEYILEAWIPFTKELSVIVTKGTHGDLSTFPVAENIHIDNILHQTIVPARISREIKENAVEIAKQIATSMNLVGTLAVEMFLTEDGRIYVNELAPRPHNSGHYTIEACETSQFQQHIRAVCGLPLGSTALLKPVVMVNILGEHLEAVMNQLHNFSDVHLHLYGKKEAKSKRKMGHITVLGTTVDEALETVNSLNIWPTKTQGEIK